MTNRKPVKARSVSKGKSQATKADQQNSPTTDIIQLILADHKPLKRLLKIMKNSDTHKLSERQEAFAEFAPLLGTHSKPEEQTMYVFLKNKKNLREEGFEGDVEHSLADQLLQEITRTEDKDLWSARVKVLAEMVEHHIEEEEAELLPDFKKHSAPEERVKMGTQFLKLKHNLEELAEGEMSAEESTEEDDEGDFDQEIRTNH